MRYWVKKEDDLLKRLWKKGLSGSQISALMTDRSRQSVLQRVRRLDLERRGPSTNRKDTFLK